MKAARFGLLSRILAVVCVMMGLLAFTARGDAAMSISADPQTVDFGSRSAGYEQPSAATITVKVLGDANAGDTGLQNVTASISNNDFVLSKTDLTHWLDVGSSTSITVRPIAGLSAKSYTATITFSGTDVSANTTRTATVSLSFTVTAGTGATAPVITTASLPGGFVGLDYGATLAATGTASITWSITNGSLPAGLSLTGSTGAISGKPTTVGTSNFTVTATNDGGSVTKDLSITVSALAITTESLPGGTVGAAYSTTLAATGATPITWSLSGGSLPAGLSLNESGVISGTPTLVGTSNFTVRATNAAGHADKALSITVVQPKTATPTASPTGGEKTAPIDVTLSCATPGATIYYTTDGSDPTTGSLAYQGAFQISSTTTVKAIAVATGMSASDVMTVAYTFEQKVATPYPSVAGGSYTAAQQVSLFCDTPSATIYYTTDGSTPTTSSAVFTEAIAIAADTTLKAMAAKSGMTASDVMTEAYTFGLPAGFVPVREIIDVPWSGHVGQFLHIEAVVHVIPMDATNQTIVWDPEILTTSNVNGGEIIAYWMTKADLLGINIEQPGGVTGGSLQIKATIIDGLAPGKDYVQTFRIYAQVPAASSCNIAVGTPMTLALIMLAFIATGLVKLPRTGRMKKK